MAGTVMLHDATPLARYAGGIQLLSRLAGAARQADEAPHGLWLLCPMDDPRKPALLDEQIVATLGENEQLVVRPAGLASTTGGPHDRPRSAARRPQGPGPRPGG